MEVELGEDVSTEEARVKSRRRAFIWYSFFFAVLNVAFSAYVFSEHSVLEILDDSYGERVLRIAELHWALVITELVTVCIGLIWYMSRVRWSIAKLKLSSGMKYKMYTRLALVAGFVILALCARISVNFALVFGESFQASNSPIQAFFYFTFLEAIPTWVIASTLGDVTLRLKLNPRRTSDLALTDLNVANEG